MRSSRIWWEADGLTRLWIVALSATAIVAAMPRAAFALASCATTISACGCQVDTAAVYETSGPLTSSSASTDCIDITAPGAVLVLAGNITGPGGGVTADGIHVMSGASNVFISGQATPGFLPLSANAVVEGFATGVQIDGSNAEIDRLNANGNITNGVVFNNVTGSDYDDSEADSDAGGDGVLISGGSSNIVGDSEADLNKNGVVIASSSNNRILDSGAGNTSRGNTVYGFWIAQSSGNQINGSGTNNNATGTYIGCFSSGGPAGKKCPAGMKNSLFNSMTNSGGNKNSDAGVAIDLGDSGNVVDESGGSSNTTDDAVDKNKKCDHNTWMEDAFSTVSQSCIH